VADRSLIAWSLERVAEVHGDPTPDVYARLFAEHPELEPLFVMDREGTVRGNMLANVFAVVLDLAGPHAYGDHMVRAEMVNHEGLGVPPAVFATFFGVVKDTLAALLGADWTPAIDAAWREVLTELDGIVRITA
jgi:hemoglobin-like flavoprotein